MKKRKFTALLLTLALCAGTVPAVRAATVAETNAYPERFDLRDYGVVTPVKMQDPFNTCWAFGGIAAETSILTTLGLTNEEYKALYGEDMIAMDNFSIKIYLTAAENEETGDYVDVKKSDWFAEDVAFVTRYGMMRGVDTGVFAPDRAVTGEQAMTILARLCGATADTMDQGVAWAADLGIANGVNRKEPLTREQFSVLLSRTARVLGVNTGTTGEPTNFADWDKVSASARNAMSWAVAAGIINGTGGNLLNPQGGVTRSQIAAMLTRYCQSAAQ